MTMENYWKLFWSKIVNIFYKWYNLHVSSINFFPTLQPLSLLSHTKISPSTFPIALTMQICLLFFWLVGRGLLGGQLPPPIAENRMAEKYEIYPANNRHCHDIEVEIIPTDYSRRPKFRITLHYLTSIDFFCLNIPGIRMSNFPTYWKNPETFIKIIFPWEKPRFGQYIIFPRS